MSGHTPGPWRWINYPDGRKILVSFGRAVVHCPDAPMTCDPPDANLIAAAPDLLTALQALLYSLSETWGDRVQHGTIILVVNAGDIDVALAAIAKAESSLTSGTETP